MTKAGWKVMVRIAARPTTEYPFGVLAIGPDGKEYQESECRDYHDCLVFGNGIIAGLMAARCDLADHNVIFDERVWPKMVAKDIKF
jgi:hypothetical protein